jgi:hypothetical protein
VKTLELVNKKREECGAYSKGCEETVSRWQTKCSARFNAAEESRRMKTKQSLWTFTIWYHLVILTEQVSSE